MSETDKLIRAIAFDRAYASAKEVCGKCGMPATKYGNIKLHLVMRCDACVGDTDDAQDTQTAPAVRALMRIAQNEPPKPEPWGNDDHR